MPDKNKYIWDDFEEDKKETFDQFNVDIEEEQIEKPKKNKRKIEKIADDIDKLKFPKVKIKVNKIFLIVIFLILVSLLSFIFIPYNSVESINIQGTNEINSQEILNQLNFNEGEKTNNFSLFKSKFSLDNDLISSYTTSYDQNVFTINIVENKPLAIISNELYILNGSDIINVGESIYDGPVIVNASTESQNKILNALKELNYDIIKEIEMIEVIDDSIDNEALLFKMSDGNYIDININQIPEKMPYYDQMYSILKSEGKDPGIIHLNLGDYYEEI